MDFSELIKEVKAVSFEEVREDETSIFVGVLIKEKLPELTAILEKNFGGVTWPVKTALAPDVKLAIREFGGISAGQTLYFHKEETSAIFAMLWPWQDDQHITVKIGQK